MQKSTFQGTLRVLKFIQIEISNCTEKTLIPNPEAQCLIQLKPTISQFTQIENFQIARPSFRSRVSSLQIHTDRTPKISFNAF